MAASKETPGEDEHYDGLAENFEDAWFFDDGYIPWVVKFVVTELELQPEDTLVDIGGGTGNYTALIAQEAGLTETPLVVDFSGGMVEQAKQKGLRGMHLDAESFSALPDERYSKAMLKETVHHIQDRPAFFAGIARQMRTGGIFAVLTRPPRPQFPFFEAALDVFEAGQEHEDVFRGEMLAAGFKQVEVKHLHYTMRMGKARWVDMLRARFMSIISAAHFSDEALEAGIREVEAKYSGADTIEFDEIFVVLLGRV
eukprot:jgi/Tetstr1/463582/TSEL_008461.t1